MGIRIKHYVDTDKIYHVEFIEKRGGKTFIKFVAPINGQKQEVELTEDEYGKMLTEGYYFK